MPQWQLTNQFHSTSYEYNISDFIIIILLASFQKNKKVPASNRKACFCSWQKSLHKIASVVISIQSTFIVWGLVSSSELGATQKTCHAVDVLSIQVLEGIKTYLCIAISLHNGIFGGWECQGEHSLFWDKVWLRGKTMDGQQNVESRIAMIKFGNLPCKELSWIKFLVSECTHRWLVGLSGSPRHCYTSLG